MKTKVYLCSRVAYDARPLNDVVARSLRAAGFEVYVPHEQAPNNLSPADMAAGRFDKETIFRLDFAALSESDVLVAVGRMGRDCAWELGYAYGQNKPIFHTGERGDIDTSPMLLPSLRCVILLPEFAGAALIKGGISNEK
jgi:nucleoside 2-deoxyribosyltransferase